MFFVREECRTHFRTIMLFNQIPIVSLIKVFFAYMYSTSNMPVGARWDARYTPTILHNLIQTFSHYALKWPTFGVHKVNNHTKNMFILHRSNSFSISCLHRAVLVHQILNMMKCSNILLYHHEYYTTTEITGNHCSLEAMCRIRLFMNFSTFFKSWTISVLYWRHWKQKGSNYLNNIIIYAGIQYNFREHISLISYVNSRQHHLLTSRKGSLCYGYIS